MAYAAKVVLDSVCEATGIRLTTMELTIPRIILAELNTHRKISKNSASSRAIPVKKQIERVRTDPFIPQKWGKNEKGMQSSQPLSNAERILAVEEWLLARDNAIHAVEILGNPEGLNVHKQWTNRLLEPWMWQTCILTATEWENLRGLRVSPEAQPDFEIGARMLFEAFDASKPQTRMVGDWHLPYVTDNDEHMLRDEFAGDTAFVMEQLKRVSAGRCARVSYLNHDGVRVPAEDLGLFTRLLFGPHLSPLEHVAQALAIPLDVGNFTGWFQFRKQIPGEAIHRRKVAVQ